MYPDVRTCMYPLVYVRVHVCTPSYTLGYMYVPPRIRQGTCMYPLVYVRVHVCTPSYTLGYMYVPPRIRQGTQM